MRRLRETIAKIDAEKQAAQDKLDSEEFNKKLSAAQTKIQTSKDKVTSAETAYNDAQATLDKLKEDFQKLLEQQGVSQGELETAIASGARKEDIVKKYFESTSKGSSAIFFVDRSIVGIILK